MLWLADLPTFDSLILPLEISYPETSQYAACERDFGMSSPAACRPSRWNSIALVISRLTSSLVAAAAIQPGKSGE